jgi:pantoate--beta-alanine ligase
VRNDEEQKAIFPLSSFLLTVSDSTFFHHSSFITHHSMLILRTIPEFRTWRASLHSGSSVGFVPTMGALHAGHMQLVEECRRGNDVTVVSIFVNPLQFGPNEDLAKYPRPFEKDAALCEAAGVAAIFAPSSMEGSAAFYAQDHATYVDVTGLDQHFCGASRPGHFRGVCTVVLKLFNVVKPHRAYFGKKDIQQALILTRMVSDLALDVEMVLSETVREPSGLALSSRNMYLSPDERERATALSRGLSQARSAHAAGERSADALKKIVRAEIESSHPTRIDYVEIAPQASLAPFREGASVDVPTVLAVAVFYGTTRLIDNTLLP